MNRSVCLLLIVIAMLAGAVSAAAQTQPQLPKVLWIFREDTKPARGGSHEKVEHGFAQYWAKNKVQPFLAVQAVSGTATEVMFLSGYDSLASMERDMQAFDKASSGAEFDALERQEADLVSTVRSTVAVLRPDMSYHPERMMSVMPQSKQSTNRPVSLQPLHAQSLERFPQVGRVRALQCSEADERHGFVTSPRDPQHLENFKFDQDRRRTHHSGRHLLYRRHHHPAAPSDRSG